MAESEKYIVETFALLIIDNLAHQGSPSGVVEDVAVLNEFQGKGIGKLMMEFAMEKCREVGCYKLTLSSNLKRTEAHAFYQSLNFEKHGLVFSLIFWNEVHYLYRNLPVLLLLQIVVGSKIFK